MSVTLRLQPLPDCTLWPSAKIFPKISSDVTKLAELARIGLLVDMPKLILSKPMLYFFTGVSLTEVIASSITVVMGTTINFFLDGR